MHFCSSYAPAIVDQSPQFEESVQILKSNGVRITKFNILKNYTLLLQMEDVIDLTSFPFRKIRFKSEQYDQKKKVIKIERKKLYTEDFRNDKPIEALVMPTMREEQFENIFMTLPNDLPEILYVEVEQNGDMLCIPWNSEPLFEYTVIFRPCRIPMIFQRRALEMLSPNLIDYIFPEPDILSEFVKAQSVGVEQLNFFNKNIAKNTEQIDAIRHIVFGPYVHAPYIIFGPPGTGKTATIIEAILQLLAANKTHRIFVTSGSNAACDNIANRLHEMIKNVTKFLRVQNTKLMRVYCDIKYNKIQSTNFIKKISCSLSDYKICDTQSINIVISTLCLSANVLANDVGCFTHMFIDEVAASTEPEALIVFTAMARSKTLENCHVIIAGDHKQLGPLIKSTVANQYGLQYSLMDRLMNSKCYEVNPITGGYDHRIQARLVRNYRSHPEIVRLYNHLYYDNKLIAMFPKENFKQFNSWEELTNIHFPIIFHAVYNPSQNSNGSVINTIEVDVIEWYLHRLLYARDLDLNPNEIGIITPYNAQDNLIKAQLVHKKWADVESGSVEKFQGREKTVIIVSLVRSHDSLGFLINPRRLNVILSRPKSLLIIIGNPVTLGRTKDFDFIIKQCEKMGTMRMTTNEMVNYSTWENNCSYTVDLEFLIKNKLVLRKKKRYVKKQK